MTTFINLKLTIIIFTLVLDKEEIVSKRGMQIILRVGSEFVRIC